MNENWANLFLPSASYKIRTVHNSNNIFEVTR
jgi:hypothetical protein